MKLHSLLLRITTLFLLGGIISCSEDSTDPVPVPDPTVMFRLTIGEPINIGSYAVLFTDTENNMLEYKVVKPGGSYEFDLAEYDKFNVHFALYNDEIFRLYSYTGYSQDTLHINGYPDFDFGDEKTRLPIEFETEITPWLLSAGSYQFNYISIYTAQPAGRFFENADILYFMRDEIDSDENDGYLFIENFDFQGDNFNISQEDLSPLSDLVLLEPDFATELGDFSPYIVIKATPKDENGIPQYPIMVFETPATNFININKIRVPDFDAFKFFETQVSAGEYLNTGKYSIISLNSYYRADHPGLPSYIKGDLEIHNEIPGSFQITGSGEYSHLEYYIGNSEISWLVYVFDESVDYSSYPAFPDTFFDSAPHGTLENLKKNVELNEPFTSIQGRLVEIDGNETRYLYKSLRR